MRGCGGHYWLLVRCRDLRLLFRPLDVRAFGCLGAVVDAIINLDWFGDMACRQTLAVTS